MERQPAEGEFVAALVNQQHKMTTKGVEQAGGR